MTEAVVELREIVTRFGAQTVHNGITLSIPRGRIVAIIGGSGSGKSVLLKEIIGLLRPSSGDVRVLGVDMWGDAALAIQAVKQRFGVLFQNGALFSALSVGENVAVPLTETLALSESTLERVVGVRLALTGLSLETALKMPSQLSGGMRKRVALARALALEPELLFLDEPTSGLDPINARAFDELVRTLCDSLGLSIVLVTHDLDTLSTIVDHVIALGDGQLIASGSMKEIASVQHPWIREYFSRHRWREGAEAPTPP